jgi:hypothetical protein
VDLPPPAPPTPAELAARLLPRGEALSADEAALAAWWAATGGHATLAESWSVRPATGAAETVRRHVRAWLAAAPTEPATVPARRERPAGAPTREGPKACDHPDWPWPPVD